MIYGLVRKLEIPANVCRGQSADVNYGGSATSVVESRRRLHGAEYPQNDLKYFPLWIARSSQSVTEENGRLPVSVALVKAFSRSLLETGTPAWQRLLAVRAVETYRDLVLGTGEPSLGEVRQVWQRLAAEQRGVGRRVPRDSRPGVEDEVRLTGVSDPNEPQCLQELRREVRLRRRAFRNNRLVQAWGSDDYRVPAWGVPPKPRCRIKAPIPASRPRKDR